MSNQTQQPVGYSGIVPTALDQLKLMKNAGERVHSSVNDLFGRLKDSLEATQRENKVLRDQLEETTRERDRLSSQNDVLLGENQGLYRDLRQLTDSISLASFEIGKGEELFGDLNAQLSSIIKMMDEPSEFDRTLEKVVPLERGSQSFAPISVPGSFAEGAFHPGAKEELAS